MIGMPELDQRMVDHLVRRAEADGAGRQEEATWSPGGVLRRGGLAAVALVRRRLGATLVGIGERLYGTAASDAVREHPAPTA
jgi:hypothetical protein